MRLEKAQLKMHGNCASKGCNIRRLTVLRLSCRDRRTEQFGSPHRQGGLNTQYTQYTLLTSKKL